VDEHTVAELHQALLARAAKRKLLRTHKLRADTTVVAANVTYPTDLGLLARTVDKLATTVQRVQAAGGASRAGPGPSAGGPPSRPPGRPGDAVAHR
jgi:IS5 family transposase